jgi:uncharacterized protein
VFSEAFTEPLWWALALSNGDVVSFGTTHTKDLTEDQVIRVRHFLVAQGLSAEALAGTAPVLPAWRRYLGVVWHHLDPATLSPARRRRLLIPSGLYGVSQGTDPIADYRLTMNTSLPGLGNVAAFWRSSLTETLARTRGEVVSLLPSEHAGAFAWDDPRLVGRVEHVDFVDASGTGAAGHEAKAAKGVVARTILERGSEALGDLTVDGWTTRRNDRGWLVVAPRRGSRS